MKVAKQNNKKNKGISQDIFYPIILISSSLFLSGIIYLLYLSL